MPRRQAVALAASNSNRKPAYAFVSSCDALMRFVGALDPILVLAIARKVLDHHIDTARHIPTSCRLKGDDLSDFEFVRAHISIAGGSSDHGYRIQQNVKL